MKMCFTKWLFISKIRSIKSLGNYDEKAKAASETEKQMHEREYNQMLA